VSFELCACLICPTEPRFLEFGHAASAREAGNEAGEAFGRPSDEDAVAAHLYATLSSLADRDVQRILDGATGQFYDDFAKRSQPFIDVVKRAQSTSMGTVTEAGIESETANDARVLVAVSVKTSIASAPEQNPRGWRMRVSVHKVGDDVKVANVEFVP